ncbi:MAG: hypothetical protein ACOYXT_29460, partial [Bacteroidota bacterium]
LTWLQYKTTIPLAYPLITGAIGKDNVQIRYNPDDLREVEFLTRRNKRLLCFLHLSQKQKITFDGYDPGWREDLDHPTQRENLNSLTFLLAESKETKSGALPGRKKYGRNRRLIELDTTSFYLKNYYEYVYKWAHRDINPQGQMEKDRELGAEQLALLDACFVLRFRKGFSYRNIYASVINELNKGEISIDRQLIDTTDIKTFWKSLQRHKASDYGDPGCNPGQLQMPGVKYARKLLGVQ